MRLALVVLLLAWSPAAAQQAAQVNIPLNPFSCDDDAALPSDTVVPPRVGYRGASEYRSNQVIYLEEYMLPGVVLPNPAYITQMDLHDERGLTPYGPASYGNITFALDDARRYSATAGFPLVQTTLPDALVSMGGWTIWPNQYPAATVSHVYSPPLAYRPGDSIVVGAECMGRNALEQATSTVGPRGDSVALTPGYEVIRLSLGVKLATHMGFAPRPTSGSVYLGNMTGSVVGVAANYCIRDVIPPLPFDGTQVRARFLARADTTMVARTISVGVRQDNTPSTRAQPVEMLVGGRSGMVLGPNTTVWTDWVPLAVHAGDMLMVSMDLLNGVNSYSYRDMSVAGSYFQPDLACALSASMGGTITHVQQRTYGVVEFQVQ
jgi:hypothetical protein